MYLQTTFSTRQVRERHHLNHTAFDQVLGKIETKFNQSAAHPGEPGTQTTFNTFHHTGVSSRNVTLMAPHLEEIINIATNIKMPSLSVYLQPEIPKDRILAKNVQQELTYTTLRTVTAAIEIRYDPGLSSTIGEHDVGFGPFVWRPLIGWVD